METVSRKMMRSSTLGKDRRLQPYSKLKKSNHDVHEPVPEPLVDFKAELSNSSALLDETASICSDAMKENLSTRLCRTLLELKTSCQSDEDKGYFSLPGSSCSPFPDVSEEDDNDESPSSSGSAVGKPKFSFLEENDASSSRPSPLAARVRGELTEENLKEWNLGQPILESSLCNPVDLLLSAEIENPSMLSDWSFESTLPLDVQVKSKVVVPGLVPGMVPSLGAGLVPSLPTACSTPAAPLKKTRAISPVIFRNTLLEQKTEEEKKKEEFISIVTRHMDENPRLNRGVFSELSRLMTQVAERGDNWQHPSDFTTRNYKKRFPAASGGPKQKLCDFLQQNDHHHKRFSKVPSRFERSPL